MDLGFYCVSFLKFPEEDAAEGKKELISQGAIVFAENNTFTLLKNFLKIYLKSGLYVWCSKYFNCLAPQVEVPNFLYFIACPI